MAGFIQARVSTDTILLVDDNPLRASMRMSLLERSASSLDGSVPGVVRAMDASEALCMVETPEFARGLALVITGHALTGISGPEFVAEFRSRMPGVPVLVLSAVPDTEKEYEGIADVSVSETRSPDELRALVGRMVGARKTA